MQLDDGLRRLIAPIMEMPREDGGEGVSERSSSACVTEGSRWEFTRRVHGVVYAEV